MSATRSSYAGAGPSNTASDPRCIGTLSCSTKKNPESSVFIRSIAALPSCLLPVSGELSARLRPVAAELLVRGDPFVGDDRRAQRDLAAQDRGRDDLGELAHLAIAVAAEELQALALGR